jgi:hypothetical protein
MTSRRSLSIGTGVVIVVSALALRGGAQAPGIAVHSDPPPVELEDPIEAILATGGQRVTIGGKTLDFWWVKSLPLMSESSAVSWTAVEEGTVVGAVKLSASYPDIRGKTIQSGLYTLRYGVQPQNGDHLGVSPYRDFLLLAPAAADSKIAALGHGGVVALAKQTPGASHPLSFSLDPPVARVGPLGPAGRAGNDSQGPTLTNDAGQTAVIFSVPVSREGKDAGDLTFGLILVGAIQP